MSTTVIASRHGAAALYLAPWRAGAVDVAAVRDAAAAHGVDLFDADRLNTQLEAIVAAGLEPAAAARLAATLRERGLTVRVVNDPVIRRSARLGNALSLLLVAAVFLSPLVFPAVLAAVNAVFVGMGGLSLPVVGAPSARPALATRTLERLRALGDHLPSHVLEPILAKADTLARDAAIHPEGPAARTLQELLADLEADEDVAVEETARSLRSELAHARRAARELG
jgi:hypothetical protein